MKKRMIAVILAVILAVSTPLSALAAGNQEIYVSEVAIGTESGLAAKGYTVLRDDRFGLAGSYIGYKTTTDPSLAITDMKVMNMYGGYTRMTYGEVLLQNDVGVTELAERIRTAVNEFKTRYSAGNPYGALAYDTLNALTYPSDNGDVTPLAEYLFSGYCTFEDYKKIALMSSNITILYIFNQLCFGVSDNNIGGESTFIDRLVANGPFVFADESGAPLDSGSTNAIYENQFDTPYMQRAQRLYVAVSDFADNYAKAKQSGKTLDNAAPSDSADEAANEAFIEGNSVAFEEEAEAVKDTTGSDETGVYALTLYALLDKRDGAGNPLYPYGAKADGTERSLGEYFVEVGSMEEGEEAYRLLYPLIAAQDSDKSVPLSAGQETMICLNGMSALTFMAFGDEASLADAKADAAKNTAEMRSLNNGKPVSIWYDVNTDIYDEDQSGVYWTSKLAQQAAAGGRYDLLTKKITQDSLTAQQKLQNAFIFTAVGALGSMILAIGIGAVVFKTASIAAALRGVISAALVFSSCFSTGACVACIIGAVCIAVAAVAIVAVVVMLIVWLIKKNQKKDDKLTLTEIPSVIYDYNSVGEGSSVTYYGVNDGSAEGKSPATNLNRNYNNTPWVALYYTRDVLAGNPIRVDALADASPIVFQTNDTSAPADYMPITFFDTVGAANLHEGASTDKVYAFMLREPGEQGDADKEGKYIENVALVSEDSELAAKSSLISKGFTVIDYNLTSDSKKASYIGYTTTDIAENAATDLRVTYASGINVNDGSVKYGDASYGVCGNIGNLVLLLTRYQSAGTPILASRLIVTGTLGSVPEGYEPVNLFCGGPAFDFNNCNGWDLKTVDDGKEGKSKWDSHAYIYFLPSVTYTSGELYLGGLAFFSGDCTAYEESAGWTPLTNENLANGLSDSEITFDLAENVQSGKTELCFTATHNPYRAVYDIQFYEAEANARALSYNISLTTGAVACDVFQQGGKIVGNNRMVRVSHAYRSNLNYEGGAGYEPADFIDTTCYRFSYDADSVCEVYDINGKETGCNLRAAGLYVSGAYTKDKTAAKPIAISELSVSADSSFDPQTQTPVRSITNAYAETGANLAFNDKYRSGNFYIYIGRADPYGEKPKYIASVNVAYFEGNDLADNKNETPYDSAVLRLVGNGAGELLTVNLTGYGSWMDNVKNYTHEYETYSQDSPIYYQKVPYVGHDTKYSVALVYVTYAKASSKGISDIEIYETNEADFTGTVTDINKSVTQACGDGFRVKNTGSYYYLRAVRNNGHAITDIVIDQDIMKRNYWTTLTTENTVSTYETYYIKTLHTKNKLMKYYISGIYSANGSTEAEAQKKLLAEGCRYCCPYNLSPDDNHPVYIGYKLSTTYKDGYSGMLLYDAGQNKTVTSVTVGRNVYTRVTDSLNGGMYDSIISLYVTRSVAKACENGAQTAKNGHYITDIVFFSGTDLNDYVDGTKSLDSLDAKTRAYIEGYLSDGEGNKLYWDIVTNDKGNIVNCNIGSGVPVYMYIHYSDNTTPIFSKLSGSVFSDNPTAVVATVVSVGLVALGLGYCLVRRRKDRDPECSD